MSIKKIQVYTLFYKSDEEFKPINNDFIDDSERIKINLENVKYFFKDMYNNLQHVNIILQELTKNKLLDHFNIETSSFISSVKYYDNFFYIPSKFNLNKFYISGDKKTLYIIQPNCLKYFSIDDEYLKNENKDEIYDLFLKSDNIPLHDDLKRKIASMADERIPIYKIFYEINDANNPNRGLQCIYKNLFKENLEKPNYLLYQTLKQPLKITRIIYCKGEEPEKIIDIKYNSKFQLILFYFFREIFNNNIKLGKFISTFNYTNLYISEDETTLFYIENNYKYNYRFNVLNSTIIKILDKLPNIEYSQELSEQNDSDYYTINLNNDLLSPELNDILYYMYNMFKCIYDIQLFKIENNRIIKTEIKANKTFKLDGDIHNWYFILTTLKTGIIRQSSNNFNINKLDNGEKIIQLVYITQQIIDKYNKLFTDLRIPIRFVRISRPQLKPLPPRIKSSQLKPLPPRIKSSQLKPLTTDDISSQLKPLPSRIKTIKTIKGGNKKSKKVLKKYS